MTQSDPWLLTSLMQELHHCTTLAPLSAEEQAQVVQSFSTLLHAWSVDTPADGVPCDFAAIRGQYHVKRAFAVAAAGGHASLLLGPRGAGKLTLARTLPTLLPARAVPYSMRLPNASAPLTAFAGNASLPCPGELTLAHEGILVLHSLADFSPAHLATLRQAMETYTVSPVKPSSFFQAFPLSIQPLVFPARFLLIATVLPCPCGETHEAWQDCACSFEQKLAYQQSISKVVDTCFDVHVEVACATSANSTQPAYREENSAAVRKHVEIARMAQARRFVGTSLRLNADLRTVHEIQQYCQLAPTATTLLRAAQRQLHLSPQHVLRLQRVARTIADLGESPTIEGTHLAEAIQYHTRLARC